MELTVAACTAAVADAGLEFGDIDGLVTWPGEVPASPGFAGPGIQQVRDALNLNLRWHTAISEAPGQAAAVIHAMMAVASGLVRHVLVYRTTTEATGQAGGFSGTNAWDLGGITGTQQWVRPFGSVTAASWFAPQFNRYLYEYGVTKEQVGWLAVTQRAHSIARGTAIYPTPLTLEDYLASRQITTPLQLYDCDVPVDGSVAFVVSIVDYAVDSPHPVRVEAVGTTVAARTFLGALGGPSDTPQQSAGRHLWERTSLRPRDVDVAALYDGFSFLTLIWLESLGFCGPGEAGAFVQGGQRIGLGGELPLNTAGGQLSQGRLHGFGHLYEACIQIRGQGGATQVPGAEVAVAAIGGGLIAGVLLLTRS